MIFDIQLDLHDEPLDSRKCSRCAGSEFRAIKFIKHPDSQGDSKARFYGANESQTSIKLALCLNCHKIVSLI